MLVQKLKVLAGTVVAVALACGGARGLWHVAAPAAAAEQPAGVPAADPAPAAGDRPTADLTEPEVGAPTGSPPRALATPGARPTRTRIGLINMTRVLKASTRFQAAQADVRKRVRQLQRQVEDLRTQVEKLQAQSTNPGTTAERREEVSEELAKLRRRIEEEQQAAQAKVTRTGSDALARTYREIEDVANRYAKAYDLDLVLFYTDAVTEADFYKPATLERKLTQPGALMPLVAAPGMDITDAVIRMLNRAHAPARTPEGTP